jgi:hypothetical protein
MPGPARSDLPSSSPLARREGEAESATRVVFEGNDAVEKVAQLLGAPGAQAGLGAPTHSLRALARALTDAGSDLAARLESRIRALQGDQNDQLAGMRRLEARDPDAFLAGALAGFALARSGLPVGEAGDSASTCEARPTHATEGSEDAGIARRPVESAQTGPGGLGSLEIPESNTLATKAK